MSSPAAKRQALDRWLDSLEHGGPPSAVVCDALDALGLSVACLGWDIVPLRPEDYVIGRAFPVAQAAVDRRPETPYRGLLRALDQITRGEVFVIPTGRSTRAAVWGELVSTACRVRGVAGAVTDGLVRDAQRVRALGFPVFARGTIPLDTHGRLEIVDLANEVTLDGVIIRRGDLIVGDADGIVVVPAEAAVDVLAAATEKLRLEARFREAVAAGTKPSEAFRRYRVL